MYQGRQVKNAFGHTLPHTPTNCHTLMKRIKLELPFNPEQCQGLHMPYHLKPVGSRFKRVRRVVPI